MSIELQVGNVTFLYPEEGSKAGWGEEATAWAKAITTTLATLSGPNDITNTSAAISDNISVAADIGVGASALSFATSAVRSFVVTYVVLRGTYVESGQMEGAWDGAEWSFQHESVGDAGMDFGITSAGQIQYYSDATPAAINFVDGDVTVGTDSIAEVGHGFVTGEQATLTTTGTLPAGLATSTRYYIIRVDDDNFKVAASLSDAVAGTAVDITAAAGGGTHTATITRGAGNIIFSAKTQDQ